MVEPVRIYIGTEPKQWLACEVLRYSVRKRTKAEVEFHNLEHLSIPLKLKMYTGFSIYRFAIPSLCKYEGRAIYLDADIIVLSDILELFNYPMQGHPALARPIIPEDLTKGYYMSVMLLDTPKLKSWNLDNWIPIINEDPPLYHKTMYGLPGGLGTPDMAPFPDCFNHLDHYDEQTKIIHYTHVPTQPWKVPGHPLAYLFLNELKAAIEDDEIPQDAVEREIAYGHIYPNILKDIGL